MRTLRRRCKVAMFNLGWAMSCYRGMFHEIEQARVHAMHAKAQRRTRPGR